MIDSGQCLPPEGHILIVEDSAIQAEALRRIIVKAGYAVTVARDGADGLAKALDTPPLLVISDIMMPKMDGFEMCRRIKSEPMLTGIPVILLTSLTDTGDVLRGLESGADNFITKPYEAEYLLSHLASALSDGVTDHDDSELQGVEIRFEDKSYVITANRRRVLNTLLTTYETAVKKNDELLKTQEEMRILNEGLEQKVQERTAALTGEIEERRQAEEHLRQYAERMRALHTIDMAVSSSFNLNFILDILLGQALKQLQMDAASVLLHDKLSHTLNFAAGQGFRTSVLKHTHLHIGEGHAGRAALERTLVTVPDLSQDQEFLRSRFFLNEGFIAYFGVPLIVKGEVRGVLEIFHRSPLKPKAEWLDFLNNLAGQAAISIDNATLFADLQRSNMNLKVAYDTTLEGWSRALDMRDRETEGHTERVAEMTVRLAREAGMNVTEVLQLRRGALLHDIGKMAIPDAILHKPGKLTEDEWQIMRQHPVYARDLLWPIEYLHPALDIPYCHHEKWDGSGYPRGLKGEQIPLAARLFSVVDVWDALRSDRPYRAAWSERTVLKHISSLAGTHFDPQVVAVFLKVVSDNAPCPHHYSEKVASA